MKAKVIEENRNPILKRKEMLVEITHDEVGTPDRLKIKSYLASQFNEKVENLFVTKVEGKTGTDHSSCHIQIYETKELAATTLPKHIITRNLPPEEREAKKKEEAKPPEAPKEKAVEKAPPPEAKAQEAKKEKASEKTQTQATQKPKK